MLIHNKLTSTFYMYLCICSVFHNQDVRVRPGSPLHSSQEMNIFICMYNRENNWSFFAGIEEGVETRKRYSLAGVETSSYKRRANTEVMRDVAFPPVYAHMVVVSIVAANL